MDEQTTRMIAELNERLIDEEGRSVRLTETVTRLTALVADVNEKICKELALQSRHTQLALASVTIITALQAFANIVLLFTR